MVWGEKPVRLAGRRHGWLVKGTANGARFDGYIGERWGRFFLALDAALRKAAGVVAGDTVAIAIEPAKTAETYLRACEQSKSTTQPGRARADAVEFPLAPTARPTQAAHRSVSSRRPSVR
jgi:hypothetical protein